MVTRLMDCTSLLWRLELAGMDVGSRWDGLVDLWMTHLDEHALAFTDAHLAMTLAGGEKKLGKFLESQHAYIEGTEGTNSEIIENVGRPLCQGMIAYCRGDFAVAADYLFPIREDIWRIGGSNAQRDVFHMSLATALIKVSRFGDARDMLNSAIAEFTTPSLLRDLSEALVGLGDTAGAEAAQAQARQMVQ